MKITNKILSLILAVLMIISIIPITASAVTYSGTCGDNLTWTYDDVTCTLTISGTGSMDNFTDYLDVPWYSRRTHIKSIIIQDGVTTIGYNAFYYCKNLENITIPTTVTEINNYAFRDCDNLKEVIIPNGVEKIGYRAFYSCSLLMNITIPESVTSIDNGAFAYCPQISYITVDNNNQYYSNDEYGVLFNSDKTTLITFTMGNKNTNYSIPDGVKTIEKEAFIGCSNLKTITMPNSVTTIGNSAFCGCTGFTNITLPDSITTIGKYAFENCVNLLSINIPNGLTIISEGLFQGCKNLTSISFPDSVTKIGSKAFYECKNLIKVTFGIGLTLIDYYAFLYCDNLTDVFYPGKEEQWKANVRIYDYGSSLYDAVMHYEYDNDTVVSESFGDNFIWNYDFTTETLTVSGNGDMGDFESTNRPWERFKAIAKKIVINDGITTVGEYAFYDFTKVTDVTISNDVIAIRYGAFRFCSNITEIIIPDSVKTIDDYAFGFCSKLETISFGKGAKSIGAYAFADCGSLTEVIISENIDDIKTQAFYYCPNLVSFKVDENNQYFSNDEYGVLFNKDKTTLIQYPSGSTSTSYTIPDGVTTLCKYAFYYEQNLESVTIPDSVTTLERVAFRDYNYALTLYYKGTQTQWDELLANNSETSDYLKNYTVICTDNTTYPSGVCGDNLTWIFNEETNTLTISGTGAMYDYEINDVSGFINQPWSDFSRNIKHIVVEDGVTSIGEAAFTSCDATDITIGDSVVSIGSEAIKYCDDLTEIIVDEDNQYYSNDEFGVLFNKDKTTLIHYPIGNQRENYTIPDGVKVIGTYAFDKCNKTLLKVTIPKSVTTIEKFAFNVTGFLAYYKVDYVGTQTEWNLVSVDGTNDIAVTYLEQEHKHDYESVVTAPTCTEQGYTTYTCECSDNYVADYVDALGHSYINGICVVCHIFTGIKDDYFYKDDVKQKAYQLVEYDGNFYFINDYNKIAKNKRIYLSQRFVEGFTYSDGTPLQVGYYEFDENGKMIINNGVVGDYFYKNGVKQKAYQLVEYEGDFYFINDANKVAKNKKIYLSQRFVEGFTYTDGTPLQVGYYEFDENGKMIMLNGPVGDYFYKNNVKLKAYQLVEFEGNYYFINDANKIAKNKRIYLSQRFVEGTDLKVGYYNFDADGKLIIE